MRTIGMDSEKYGGGAAEDEEGVGGLSDIAQEPPHASHGLGRGGGLQGGEREATAGRMR